MNRTSPWRSQCFAKTQNPSAKLFQVTPPVPYAVRVNDVSERRPFLQFLGRSTHRRRDFGPRQDQFLAKKMWRRGPIRLNQLPVDAFHLAARTLFRWPPSRFKFTNLFSPRSLPVGQMRQQILRGPFRGDTHRAHFCPAERIKPRNQFLEDPQFLLSEHRRVHHRVAHDFGDGRSSMRSAMTARLFHARTVRQRTAMPVEYVPPRTVSQSVMKFPSLS